MKYCNVKLEIDQDLLTKIQDIKPPHETTEEFVSRVIAETLPKIYNGELTAQCWEFGCVTNLSLKLEKIMK
jgi:hypothetical protein